MTLTSQIIWLLVLAIPVATISWTVTHEEILREPREWCLRKSQNASSFAERKLLYVFTCEFCFSHWVALSVLLVTGFRLLYADWRGYVIALFSLVGIANVYMNLYGAIRLDLRRERVEIQKTEKEVQKAARSLDDEKISEGRRPAA